MIRRTRWAGLCLVVVAALVGTAGAAAAALPGRPAPAQDGTVTWAVQPADTEGPDGRVSFRYELDPGGVVADNVIVTNYSEVDVDFRLYASDGVTTPSGAFDLLPGSRPPVDAGSWVTLAETSVRLGPRQARIVPFTVTVPPNATPGDHPAGIVAAVGDTAGATDVTVERRVGARVHLRVGGELAPRLDVSALDVGYGGGWRPDAPAVSTWRSTWSTPGTCACAAPRCWS
ncbi:hypothetical protein BJF78_28565 [Pseudonocardia sp. CNS-139]|nr:hypothetical protein BJF78_28565 [Pseudonocardia sp. CNS-139]